MQHPNMAPFIGRQLIQHLVKSNPTPAYVQRVAQAFVNGRFTSGAASFGTGRRGDLAATAAAILLDPEARATPTAGAKLREPVLEFTGLVRAMNGFSDGDAFGYWWGDKLRQHVFRPPSVFNFYTPDYPVPGTDLVGPAFGILGASTAIERLNVLTFLLWWNGQVPSTAIPGALGTKVQLDAFLADAADAPKLVDRLSVLAFGRALPTTDRQQVLTAVEAVTSRNTGADKWQLERVRQAAYLVFAHPQYHVQR
jgi:hypothetical protein